MEPTQLLKIAVCDDDKVFLTYLDTRIRQYCQKKSLNYSLHLFSDVAEFWQTFTSEAFQIVFLDVIMPEMTGIDLSRKIFSHNRNCVIAFISSSPDFAIEGYGVNAVGYLLKPPDEKQVASLMEKSLQHLNDMRPKQVMFKTGSLTRKIPADDIIYLESRNKLVLVHCRNEVFVVPGKLSVILDTLPANFVQTHKSYVANLDHVISMSREEMWSANDVKIPVSRQFHKDASRRYREFMTGEL